jgi:hypothetical protein
MLDGYRCPFRVASTTVVSRRESRGFDAESGRSGPKLGESVAKQTTQRDKRLKKA